MEVLTKYEGKYKPIDETLTPILMLREKIYKTTLTEIISTYTDLFIVFNTCYDLYEL